MTLRILVTGSRDWVDADAIGAALIAFGRELSATPADVVVVHGGARGADTIAGRWARDFGIREEVHRADWRRADGTVDRAAGIRRNQAMVDAGADVCLAFIRNVSPGATHCASAAQAAGIRTLIVRAP